MTDPNEGEETFCRQLAGSLGRAHTHGPIARPPTLNARRAHRVREMMLEDWRMRRHEVGRKIGLTSPEVRAALGAHEPTDGFLFEDMRVPSGRSITLESLIAPLVEAEVGIVLARGILCVKEDPIALLPAIAGATAAIELVDSRFVAWKIGYPEAIADNGSSAMFVLGEELHPVELASSFAWLSLLEGSGVTRASGTRAILPILADLRWLAAKAIACGEPLQAGDIVLTGALGSVAPVADGATFSVEITGFGDCSIRFAAPTTFGSNA